ncbi:MAG: dienelactone hydrolase [Frankiales bacterium]|nr:dienelactone hydrolase [Frankiales bacterium]
MASIVLLHSAVGLRPAVLADAERLRSAGHTVVTPDMYEGATFRTVEEGVAHRDVVGEDVLAVRAAAATEGLPPGQVWAGYSLGGWFALEALQRHGGAGALFVGFDGAPSNGVPCQVHVADGDPWVEQDALTALAARGVEVHRYAGGHLFCDPDLPDSDAASTALLWERALEFLARL